MSIDRFFVRDVTILRAGTTTDGYGQVTPDWTSPASTSVEGWLAQTQQNEPQGAGRTLVTVIRDVLFLPAGTEIDAHDRVVIDGQTFEVDGPPNRAWTPRGEHHLEVPLVAVEA